MGEENKILLGAGASACWGASICHLQLFWVHLWNPCFWLLGSISPPSVVILGLPLEPVLLAIGEHLSATCSYSGFTSGFNIVIVLLSMQEGYHRSRGSERWRKHETGRFLSLSEATSSGVGMGELQGKGHPYIGKGSDTALKSQVQFLS